MQSAKEEYKTIFSPAIKYLDKPWQMNLELTTKCPLHCPQCYVALNQGTEMSIDTALYRIRDGAAAGVKHVNLSGGETLCYPYLKELVIECKKQEMECAIAISGIYADRKTLEELIEAGVDKIFVSLNGSTEEINSKTRDGYHFAIKALETLKEIGFENRFINWVMHSYNAEDLPQMIELGERLGVKGIAVMAFKPDSSHELKSFPSKEQMQAAASVIKKYRGKMVLEPEPCFSPLRAMVHKSVMGNLNMGAFRGCAAGRNSLSVAVDGRLTPCRHLDIREDYEHIADYWNESKFIQELRGIEAARKAPCKGCVYEYNCLPCQAVGVKLHDHLNYGMEECPVKEPAD